LQTVFRTVSICQDRVDLCIISKQFGSSLMRNKVADVIYINMTQ